jgi:cellulose synthase/poly-beta-1,6-N-acetylglucosamine synthase-like glycosyltransferase
MLNGFNFVEMQAKSDLDLVIPVTGSNFMARTAVLRAFPFEEDIAEDWNLTLRLWCEGKRVSYDRELAVASESPSGLRGAMSQFSRWAEGTTRNTIRNARKIAGSRSLRLHQKVDAIASGMSYSTAVLFFGIFAGGVLMPVPAFAAPPTPFLFWGTAIGLMGLPAAPLSLVAACRTCPTHHRAKAVLSAILETYVVIPFTAYAVIRGFFGGHGAFNRTDKSGWTN